MQIIYLKMYNSYPKFIMQTYLFFVLPSNCSQQLPIREFCLGECFLWSLFQDRGAALPVHANSPCGVCSCFDELCHEKRGGKEVVKWHMMPLLREGPRPVHHCDETETMPNGPILFFPCVYLKVEGVARLRLATCPCFQAIFSGFCRTILAHVTSTWNKKSQEINEGNIEVQSNLHKKILFWS